MLSHLLSVYIFSSKIKQCINGELPKKCHYFFNFKFFIKMRSVFIKINPTFAYIRLSRQSLLLSSFIVLKVTSAIIPPPSLLQLSFLSLMKFEMDAFVAVARLINCQDRIGKKAMSLSCQSTFMQNLQIKNGKY